MNKCFCKTLKKCDIFGAPVKLTLNRKYRQNSSFGGFLSCVLFIIFFVLCFESFYSLLNHDDFLSYSQEIFNVNAPKLDLIPSKFNYAISFSDTRMNNGKYFKIDILQAFTYFNEKDNKSERNRISLLTEPCRSDYFQPDLRSAFEALDNSTNLESFMCGTKNQEIILKGTHSSVDFSYFLIKVSACQNTSNRTCVSENEIIDIFNENGNRIYLNVYISNNIINSNDFDSPVYSFIEDKVYVMLDLQYYKEKNFYLTQNQIFTDSNLIQTNFQEQINTYTYENNYDETSIKLDSITDSTLFAAIYIRSNNLSKNHYRTGLKIGRYISYLGGFWSFLYFAFSLIGKHYNLKRIQIKIANSLYDFTETNPNDHNNGTVHNIKEKKKTINFSSKMPKINPYNSPNVTVMKNAALKDITHKKSLKELLQTKILKFLKENRGVKLFYDCQFLINFLFNRKKAHSNEIQKILRKKAKLALQKDLDIVHLLQKIKTYDKLKLLLLNNDQNFAFQFIQKNLISPFNDSHLITRSTKLFVNNLKEFKGEYLNLKETLDDYGKLFNCYQALKNDQSETNHNLNRKIIKEIKPEIIKIFEEEDLSSALVNLSIKFKKNNHP